MFLPSNDQIREAITALQAEDPVGVTKFAVAFWGTSAEYVLRGRCHIICDLFSGACNPATIRAINQRQSCVALHLDGLHAKVVINQAGAIVSSANMSTNGLGREGADDAGTLEAGFRVAAGTPEHAHIDAWFDELWRLASPITDDAYARAERIYRARNGFVAPDEPPPPLGSPRLLALPIPSELLLKESISGENRVRSVTDQILHIAERVHPHVGRKMLGKVATFACHAILCRTGAHLSYERSGDDPGGIVTESWITGRFQITGKETRSRVDALLREFSKCSELPARVRHVAAEVLANPDWTHL